MADRRKSKRRKILVFTGIVLGLAVLTALAVFRKREVVIEVETDKVTRRTITEIVVANGRIEPVLQVKISAEVSGEIIELPVKEGQRVDKGDLLVRIKPDLYEANVKSAEAGYNQALASKALAEANLRKAELEYKRNQELFDARLISESVFLEYKTAYDVAQAQYQSAVYQVEVAKASLQRAKEELAKTSIYSPICGTVSKLNSELGERVVGTAMMTGTEIMTVADLDQMEARVDVGETDIVLVRLGQKARLEVDAFRDRKFTGTVTEIANSSRVVPGAQTQEATKFEVRIRIQEKEKFRPGMSVTAEIETRTHTNVLAVPVQCVTTRLPKPEKNASATNRNDRATHGPTGETSSTSKPEADQATNASASATATNAAAESAKSAKPGQPPKPIEVVFVVEGDHVRMVPVKRGISDDNYTEIVEGLEEGWEVVSGGYRAINRDLQDGSKIRRKAKRPTGPASPNP